MKKLFLLISILAVSIVASAAVVSPERAMQVAQSFVPTQKVPKKNAKGQTAAPQTSQIVYTHYMPNSGRPAIYVVNIGNGFALVSADDVAHPILGYNYGKAWPIDGQALPPSVKGFLDDLAAQMEAASEHPQDAATAAEWQHPRRTPKRTPSSLPDSVGPLLTTTWNQGQYYNALCPEDGQGPDGHVYTGCVATAMAQIINYWGQQATIHTRGTHSYQSNYGELTINYDTTTYDFANMPNALTSESTPAQVNEVAKLMYHCGVATNMMYGPAESSAYDIDARAALINFFHISPDASHAEKAYYSDEEWNNMLRENIAAGKPIMYSGQGTTGGHTFVCDGYKQDSYFSFNFGWGGFADGWYLTNAVNPAYYQFNSSQAIVLDIMPDDTSNVILGQLTGTSIFTLDEPMEFCHIRGYNKYQCTNYSNPCYNQIVFVSSDNSELVADILEFEDQNVSIYDGIGETNLLRSLYAGGDNDKSPIVSSDSVITFVYSGNFYNAGFQLQISKNSECRMVSNILTAIDTTTVHLSWTENGSATQWQVEYGVRGFKHGEGTFIFVDDNTMVHITFPKKLTQYDLYIRPLCGENEFGLWNKVTVQSEAPYWQDVVTSKPDSYTIDEETNYAIISTPEDFVWHMQLGNYNLVEGALLVGDIDMKGYKWHPNYDDNVHFCLNGGGYSIKNLYIKEIRSHTALFPYFSGKIENLGVENAQVYGTEGVSALCGELRSQGCVINSHVSNSTIEGTDMVAGMVAYCYGTIENSYVDVSVDGNRWSGLMTGSFQGTINNCYATGSIRLHSFCYYAGISAYAIGGQISHSYSIDLPMGVVGYRGQTLISDTSSFYKNEDVWSLRTPIEFEGAMEANLLKALNKQVEQLNDSNLRNWVADTIMINNGLPIFGNHFVVKYPNVSNLTMRNIKVDTIPGVVVDWDEKGDALTWEIRYQPVNTSRDSAIIIRTTYKPDTLYGLELAREYTISVRSIHNNNQHSGWEYVTEMIDLPFWTDFVTEKPEGFIEDADGNVTISTAEGLAWLACVVNGLHGIEKQSLAGKIISLVADLNLQGYRWYPIGRNWEIPFCGTFQGNGHTIYNLYVNSSGTCLGLFGYAGAGAEFTNVAIKNGYVNSYFYAGDGGGYGGLLGMGSEVKKIVDCKSDAVVIGTMQIGSLCGCLSDFEGEATVVSNCCATGDVYGRESTAGLIGEARGIVVQNCYATGDVNLKKGNWNAWYRGGLIGNFMSNAVVENCYATGSVEIDDNSSSWFGRVIGCPYMDSKAHYIYGLNGDLPFAGPSSTGDVITDTSSFVIMDNQQLLLTPITITDSVYDNLLEVLNAWVAKANDPILKTWVIDPTKNMGCPIFGNNYEPTCFNPTNVTISNATQIGDTIVSTKIEWEQVGEASSWEILYTIPKLGIDSGVIISVNNNPCVLTELPVGKLLDFYVRTVCDDNHKSGWSKPFRYIPDKLHWTEVVTSKPDGYQDDSNGNIYISSAEGLAWLASVTNRLNSNYDQTKINAVILTSDINLSEYRWTPINYRDYFRFDGNGHTIRGLYCNEYADRQGLFGNSVCSVENVIISESSIHGLLYCGTIFGSSSGQIKNCIVNGEVEALQYIGGFCGETYGAITNSAFVGTIHPREDVTISNQIRGYAGGITGNTVNNVENSYVSVCIPESAFSGIITGLGVSPQLVSNSYYKVFQTTLPITTENCETHNISSFAGSDFTWTLNTPPYISGAFYSDLVEALNAWVDANNSEGEYRHWMADTENINGGFPIFDPNDSPSTGIGNINVNTNAVKIFHDGQIFILRGDKTYTLQGQEVR